MKSIAEVEQLRQDSSILSDSWCYWYGYGLGMEGGVLNLDRLRRLRKPDIVQMGFEDAKGDLDAYKGN